MDAPTTKIAKRPYWLPLISEKQEMIMMLRQRYCLITGPRQSGKTRGVLHDLVLHAYNNEYARIAMVGRTQTVNADGGPWATLQRVIIPEWERGIGLELVTPAKMDGATHKIFCEIRNKHGGTSIIQLDSLAVESDVNERYKGKEYSYIYMTEADNFQCRLTFDVLQECLRGIPNMKPEHYKLVADCNPAESGEDHWLHDLFYKERLRTDFDDIADPKRVELMKRRQEKFAVMEFTIDDNIFFTQEQRDEQWSKYAHDKDLLDRYYYGRWVKASGDSIFRLQFKPMIHVVDAGSDPRDPLILLPEETCSSLLTGSDIGSANNALVFAEEIRVSRQVMEDGKHVMKDVPAFKFLDEFVSIGENMSIATLVENMMEKMDFWESQCSGKIWWQHISDRSAFEKYNSSSDSYEHQEVFAESFGRIELEKGPAKRDGSVQASINLFKKLLFQDRIFISSKCPQLILMFKNMKAGKYKAIALHSEWKHVYDAARYLVCKICWAEMESTAWEIAGRRSGSPKSIISV